MLSEQAGRKIVAIGVGLAHSRPSPLLARARHLWYPPLRGVLGMSEQAKRFRAFISYSQKDKSQARRLHRALEAYRVPAGIDARGRKAKILKLGRFFRDEEELGAASDLGSALQGAIADSENLIVVCSPHAAKSRWVNEEIIHFKRTGRADRIFAVT